MNRLAVIRRRASYLARTVGRYMPDTDAVPEVEDESLESVVRSMKQDAVSGALASRRRTTGVK